MRWRLSILIFILSRLSLAEFGWLPKEKGLDLRAGLDYLSTSSNFDSTGAKADVVFSGEFLKFSEVKFFVEPEYAFSPDWSARIRLGFVTNSATSDSGRTAGSILSGNGMGDIIVAIKHRLIKGKPGLVFEAATGFPTYTRTIKFNDDLIVGDGSLDLNLALHGSYSLGRFLFAASPYFLFRTGGYAQRVGMNLGAGIRVAPAYLMPFTEFFFALGDNLLFDSSERLHDSIGAGGSYLRLSGSPSAWNVGVKLGVGATQMIFFESYFKTSVWGIRYPAFFQVGANMMFRFDFFEPDLRPKAHEIPFEANPEDYTPPASTPAPNPSSKSK